MQIVTLGFDVLRYCPDWMCEFDESYSPYNEEAIQLGASRIGGHVFDIPSTLTVPRNAQCVGQLRLSEFSVVASRCGKRLPENGHLYFFSVDDSPNGCIVVHDSSSDLTREVGDGTFAGALVTSVEASIEKLESKYLLEGGERVWDDSAGSKQTKLFGLATHCHWSQEEVIAAAESKTVLLQIGEDVLPEGTISFLIDNEALECGDFSGVQALWGMS